MENDVNQNASQREDTDSAETANETTGEAAAETSTEAGQESPSAATPESEIETLKAILKEQQSKYLYLYADFENYKKRAIRERSDILKFGHENLARELLQVIDNLERALEHAANGDALATGIQMVAQLFRETLSKFGIIPMDTIGKVFDPEFHEAVGQEESSDAKPGTVLHEAQKGYLLHTRLLRPARVIVATSSKS